MQFDALTVGAFSDWRLPFIVDTGTPGCNFSYVGGTDCGYQVQTKTGDTVFSELAHMFYLTLGNTPYYDADGVDPQNGWGLTNTGPFRDLVSANKIYWTSNEYPYDDTHQDDAWVFRISDGFQGSNVKGDRARRDAIEPFGINELAHGQPVECSQLGRVLG